MKINENNGAIGARTYIKQKTGIDFSKSEDERLYLTDFCKKINPKIFRGALDKLIICNKNAKYYDENSLKRKCKDVWKKYIELLRNPFFIFLGLWIKKGQVFKIKTNQFLRVIKRVFTS